MEITVVLFLIVLKGVFSMSEVAFISVKKNRSEKGNSKTKTGLESVNTSGQFLSALQIGTTLILILIGVFCSTTLIRETTVFIAQNEILLPYAELFALVIVILSVTFLTLVFGELVPKRIGSTYPEVVCKLVVTPIKYLSVTVAPFIWILAQTTNLLIKICKIKPQIEVKVTEEEIKAIIKEGTEDGEVQEIEQDIVERVFHIGDRKVNSLMTHRKSVISLPLNADKEKIKELVFNDLHSAYPVYDENHDDIVGVVRLRHLFSKFEKEDFNLKSILTEAPFIMEHTSAYKALEDFKQSHIHYALVSDEYGIFQGIITLNDILEALVGNASDFYEEDFQLVEREDGTWLVDGHYSLHDFLIFFGLGDMISEYDVITVSGLIMTELSHIPDEGEKLIWKDYELEVIDMDGAKIDKVMVRAIDTVNSQNITE